jgi:rare lipoprotein A
MRRTLLPAVLLSALATACASSHPRGAAVERGIASWYGPGFHGNRTASGQRYDMWALTAAHRTLPLGTIVEVRNLDNERTVRVTINDRGPFAKRRILDLSRAAADALGIVGPGTAPVEIVAVGIEPIGGTSFAVQVGAFLEAERAQALAESLRALYPAVTVTTDEVWSRVQLGEFGDRDAAEKIARELRRAGYAPLVLAVSKL